MGKENRIKKWWQFVVVMFIAVLIRLVYLIQARQNDPLFFSPQLDALYHHQWAVAILNRIQFIDDAYFRAPLYPFFLAVIYRIVGANLFWAKVVQALLGGLSCGLLSLLGRKIFNSGTGFIAGLVMAFYPLFIYFDGELLIPVLLVFLLLAGFLAFYYCQEKKKHWWLPGLIYGLAGIARPNVILFVVILFFWLIYSRKNFWRQAVPFLVAFIIPILPVTARNYLKSGHLVLIAWQGGTNFYIGNNEFSDGTTAIVPKTRGSWWGGYNDVKIGAEKTLGRELKGAEIDRFWFKKGLEFWRRHPIKAVLLTIRKTYLWFNGYEVSNDRDLYFFKRYTFLNYLLFNTPILKFPFGVLLPLALTGIYLTRKRWRLLLPVYLFLIAYPLSFIPFFITARYRLPVIPFYFLFAVAGIKCLTSAFRRRSNLKSQPLLYPGAKVKPHPVIMISVLSFVLFNLNLAGAGRIADPAQNHFTAGLGYYEQGKVAAAEKEIAQALKLDSATNILSLQVSILLEQHRLAEAKRMAEAVVRLHPDEADAYGIAGNVMATAGEIARAETLFQKVVELDPYSVEGWNNLGNIALLRRNFARARTFYQRALELNPSFPTALFQLGLVHYYQGDKESAHLLWQRVLKLAPNHEKTRRALEQLR